MPKKIDEETREEAAKLYAHGKELKKISDETGICTRTLIRWKQSDKEWQNMVLEQGKELDLTLQQIRQRNQIAAAELAEESITCLKRAMKDEETALDAAKFVAKETGAVRDAGRRMGIEDKETQETAGVTVILNTGIEGRTIDVMPENRIEQGSE